MPNPKSIICVCHGKPLYLCPNQHKNQSNQDKDHTIRANSDGTVEHIKQQD